MIIEQKKQRFKDENKYIHEFTDKFLIVCPQCSQRAEVVLAEKIDFNPSNHLFLQRKLVCSNCGFSKRKIHKGIVSVSISARKDASRYAVIGGNFDWYFQEPLWLQKECCGEILWAYNQKHLEFIEGYISAKLRERVPNKNSSLASRFPKWMKLGKNRDVILTTIAKLKEKLNGKY